MSKPNKAQTIFEPIEIGKEEFDDSNKSDLTELYKRTHEELSLQQSKRDSIIAVFLSLIGFAIPLSLGFSMPWFAKGIVVFVVGLIGFIFSLIITRYREYKESYWLAVRSLGMFKNCNSKHSYKEVIQSLYYSCLEKSGKKFINPKTGKLSLHLIIRKNLYSAETLYFVIMSLISSIFMGVGIALAIYPLINNLVIVIVGGSAIGLIIFHGLMYLYYIRIYKIYRVLETKLSSDFNVSFGKAWTLHNYKD